MQPVGVQHTQAYPLPHRTYRADHGRSRHRARQHRDRRDDRAAARQMEGLLSCLTAFINVYFDRMGETASRTEGRRSHRSIVV